MHLEMWLPKKHHKIFTSEEEEAEEFVLKEEDVEEVVLLREPRCQGAPEDAPGTNFITFLPANRIMLMAVWISAEDFHLELTKQKLRLEAFSRS